MKISISRSSLLTMLVIVALAAAVPFAVVEFMKTGEFYLLSHRFADETVRSTSDVGRLSAPGIRRNTLLRRGAMISDLIATLPRERHAALEHHRERLNATIARCFADEEEKLEASVEDRRGLGVPHARPEPTRRVTK